jgi:hypothetical protein
VDEKAKASNIYLAAKRIYENPFRTKTIVFRLWFLPKALIAFHPGRSTL